MVVIGGAGALLLYGNNAGWFDGSGTFTTVKVNADNCPDDGVTTLYVKVFDDWSSTPNTPLAGSTLYARNLDSGVIENNGTSSSSTDWASIDLTCGKRYKVYAETNAGTTGSAVSEEIITTEDKQYVRLHTGSLSKMTVKLKDITGDDWEYGFADAKTSGTNSTTGVDMNATNFYDAVGATDFTIASDGEFDLEFEVKTASSREFGNDKAMIGNGDEQTSYGHKNYVCVDLGGATNGQEWDEDTMRVTVSGGSSLTDVKTQIDADSLDYVYLQKVEACYEIGDIDDSFTTIGFYVKAKSGENPDNTDDDITLYFFGEGIYKSSDNLDVMKAGIFTDASTQQPVLYDSEVPYVVLNVA